jgi:hypothetical protein
MGVLENSLFLEELVMKKLLLSLTAILLAHGYAISAQEVQTETISLPIRILIEDKNDKVTAEDISPLAQSLTSLLEQPVVLPAEKIAEEKPAVSECVGFIAEKPALEEKQRDTSTKFFDKRGSEQDEEESIKSKRFKKHKYKKKYGKKFGKKAYKHDYTMEPDFDLFDELEEQE